MSWTKTVVALIAVAAIAIVINACERTITETAPATTTGASSCFACHDDNDTFLIAAEQQWENSAHASGLNTNRNTSPCSMCHTSEGFKDELAGAGAGSYPDATMIHCFTCHAPHTNGNFTTRIGPDQPQSLENGVSVDINGANLCVACHHARQDVDTYVSGSIRLSSHWGPHHSPQADNLFGSNGYEYSGFSYRDMPAHRLGTADGCLDCHFRTTQNFRVGGHSFNMRASMPSEFDPVTEEDLTEILNTAACFKCHGDLDDFDVNGVQTRIVALTDSLITILENAGIVDADGHPLSVTVPQDTAGAVWNLLMIEEGRSKGVHNPWWLEDLLVSSIMYMQGNLPQPSAESTVPLAARKPQDTALNP